MITALRWLIYFIACGRLPDRHRCQRYYRRVGDAANLLI
ncbi:hypothetical protein AC03_4847 [Escherichia coli 3-073-06_S3_C1]|nr:hypothetical protein AC13_5227 [Escherichia coli 2-011-08_S3_C2]KDW69272.1 hypothetical protein AC65_5065 [Escherichia coli 2-005-03_S4_C1]KDY83600.1 hypothetical protein AB92_5021 [Escherichia coli 2-474-04_S3_C1]KDY85843.1 hypothetical protein AC21_4964 [Escherichia coli 2-474-04_S3_C2]KDZ09873.1 hypothetical protein AC50_5045 [Escherichia coli 2-474-04_S3_C3]KDZ58346.1 hypothetical protein AC03_4847 [Escherichia coli 3-073-06_S3_C1]KDZ58787.1 hypothetical protein AC31_4985 [Escherichia 